MRCDKNHYFLKIAEVVALRSTCLRHNVGAIIVRDSIILSTGYNGSPRGFKHCETCIRDVKNIKSGDNTEICFSVHAEANAIINAARNGVSIIDGELYCTHAPCTNCLKMIINAGIIKIYASENYEDSIRDEILKVSGIPLVLYNE
jgi:dCMP deaminase